MTWLGRVRLPGGTPVILGGDGRWAVAGLGSEALEGTLRAVLDLNFSPHPPDVEGAAQTTLGTTTYAVRAVLAAARLLGGAAEFPPPAAPQSAGRGRR
jgi:hypothetical protein